MLDYIFKKDIIHCRNNADVFTFDWTNRSDIYSVRRKLAGDILDNKQSKHVLIGKLF